VRTSQFAFELPAELVAQVPSPIRDQSRLLVLQRPGGEMAHRRFPDLLEYFQPGDVLVLNDSKVILARLRGINSQSGGEIEVLLLEENSVNDWWVMLRPGKRARVNTRIIFRTRSGEYMGVQATVIDRNSEGHRRLHFSGTPDISAMLGLLGEVPLPPYIQGNRPEDFARALERYQTVYAQVDGSVAAPTAGLHFTEQLLERIRERGVEICYVTLHVGLGTFAPVKTETLDAHVMHEERFRISAETTQRVNAAKAEGRRVVAVGTTSVRVLETVAAASSGRMAPGAGRTRLFIYPPWRFKIVDVLLTNFHLPRSTLLMLVSALAAPGERHGREMILSAYAEAIRQRYRFFSYGDAMLIL
jgi:S-adenosylmethionine:tRNA ribosyltransferase-isomerase